MDRYRHLELFLRNRLAKPTEGRHFRTHGIVRNDAPKPMARKRVDWVNIACMLGLVVAALFTGAMLAWRG